MSRNVFNNETETGIGERLLNIQSLNVVQDTVPVLSIDNVVENVNISSYGKTLLNQTSVSSLRNAILQADTSVEINDTAVGEINLNVDNNLKLQILGDKSIFHNDILVDNIKRKTDDTNAISFASTTMTLQKPMTIFRDSTDKGYMRLQNSTTNKTGYIDFITGENQRIAYLGQGEENDLTKTGNFLYLGLEGQCGYSINDGAVPIFQVNLENDRIDLNYTTNANGNFIMKNDNAHKEINNNNNLPFLKVPSGQSYSANLYGESASTGLLVSKTPLHYKIDGKVANADVDVYIPKSQCDTLTSNTSITTPTIVAQSVRSKQGNSEILLKSFDDLNQIRLIPGGLNYIQSNSNILSFSKFGDSAVQFKIDHNNTGTSNTGSLTTNYDMRIDIKPNNLNYCLYRAPAGEQVSLYTHSGEDSGGFLCQKTASGLHIKLNSYIQGGHKNLCLNSSNYGKLIVGSETEYTDNEKFIINSTTLYKNGLNSDGDINLNTTSKLHFSSNNYFANDANHNLNLFLNNSKKFIADTGNEQSSYEFKIGNNSVMKLSRNLSSSPISNKTQISSEELLIRDDNIAGGSISLQRSGASQQFCGYINYFVSNNGNNSRLFYTGFNDGGVAGQPLHYMEDICKSYTYKNSLGMIMKIHSHSGVIGANTNYIEIGNRLETPTLNTLNINMYNSNYVDGTTPNNDDGYNEIIGRKSATNDVGHLRMSAGGGTTPSTSKTLIDIFGSDTEANRKIEFKVGSQPIFTLSSSQLICGNSIVPSGTINVGKINNRWSNVYSTNVNSNTGLFSTNIQTPSLISSTNTATYQSRLDMDDLLATFVCRDVNGVEKSILIGSYNALVANVQITANNGILMNNTFNSRDVIPTGDGQYDLGSSSQHFKDIYATNNVIDTSDRNKKKDIQPIVNALETIMKLKPVSYKFKDGKSGRTHTGFIAQDCKDTYIKDWAGYVETDGKHYGLRYAQFISLNTQAIQELYKIVENKNDIVIPKSTNNDTEQLRVDIDEIIQEKEEFKTELNKTKTQNLILEERVIDLENKLKIIENKSEDVEESDGGVNMIELLQSRNHELELKYTKLEAKLKKLSSIVNKLVKK